MVDTLDCPGTNAWTLRIGGPQPDENRTSLLFTPQNPCGVERDPTFDPTLNSPLVRIATARFCLGDGCDPTRMVLIRGHVQSLDSIRGPGVIDPRTIDSCDGASSAPRVKLEVWPCGWPGGVIIDSDSEIVVPAGDTSINVLAPGPNPSGGGGPNAGGWIRGRTTLTDAVGWTDVTLRIAACPIDCYVPPGVLTEWAAQVIDTTPVADRILVRPRRARRLELNTRDALGVATATQVDLLQDTAGATISLGSILFPTGPATVNMFGAAQAIVLVGSGAGTFAYIRWEIR